MSDINEEQKRLYKRAEENDIKLLKEENKKLKNLCDKYEEEHNTTFIEWQKDIKANKKAIEYINKLTTHHESYDYDIDYDYKKEIINILKGDNK